MLPLFSTVPFVTICYSCSITRNSVGLYVRDVKLFIVVSVRSGPVLVRGTMITRVHVKKTYIMWSPVIQ